MSVTTALTTPRCRYCGLSLAPADHRRGMHPICREEACERPAAVSSCPDNDPTCPACTPEEPQS